LLLSISQIHQEQAIPSQRVNAGDEIFTNISFDFVE
jgi:hypothetical protein